MKKEGGVKRGDCSQAIVSSHDLTNENRYYNFTLDANQAKYHTGKHRGF